MDLLELTASAGNQSGGTLLLTNGRCIIVKRVSHVGEAFLFYSLPGSIETQAVGHDEIQAWVPITPDLPRWSNSSMIRSRIAGFDLI